MIDTRQRSHGWLCDARHHLAVELISAHIGPNPTWSDLIAGLLNTVRISWLMLRSLNHVSQIDSFQNLSITWGMADHDCPL